MKGRFIFIFAGFLLVYLSIGAKLYSEQVGKDIFGRPQASGNPEFRIADRGQIFFSARSGEDVPVALVKNYPSIFVSPRDIDDPRSVAALIAPIANADAAELERGITERKAEDSEYMLIVPRAGDEQVRAVEDLKLKGVSVEERQGRFYPFHELGSQIVGYVDKRSESKTPQGLYGIEKMYDESLAKGDSLHLTIDRAIQDTAESMLEELVTEYGADGGTIIVQKPETGEIVAMATKPDFDPNEYNEYPIKNFLNPAVQLLYEPGSVIKPLTLSAGIDTGSVTPETTYVDTGSVTLNGMTVRNFEHKTYGKISMREMIQNSVNTGAIFAERAVGHQTFYRYLTNFGFDEKTGIELPGEVSSNIRNLVRKDVRAIDFATASYGQGISVTPIALISAYSALANDGVLMRPFIVKENGPEIVRRVTKQETAKTVTDILVSSVVKNRVAAIPNYNVAGKTGTAFIADPKTGKYSEEMIHTFVGYAPATDPKFTILVKLERPAHGETAGVTVVPKFRKLAEYLLSYYRLPPDNLAK